MIKNYFHFFLKPNTSSGVSGGIIVYVKNHLKFRTVLVKCDVTNGIITLKIISDNPNTSKNLILKFVYCRTCNFPEHVKSFYETLSNDIAELS